MEEKTIARNILFSSARNSLALCWLWHKHRQTQTSFNLPLDYFCLQSSFNSQANSNRLASSWISGCYWPQFIPGPQVAQRGCYGHTAIHTPNKSELKYYKCCSQTSDCTHKYISSVCSGPGMQALCFWPAFQGKTEGFTGSILPQKRQRQ